MVSGAAKNVIREFSVHENEGEYTASSRFTDYVKCYFVQDAGMFHSDHPPSG